MPKTPTKAGGGSSTSKSRSPSPTSKKPSDPDIDLKLDKIKITPFSEAKDWESTVFELKLLLKQAWKDPRMQHFGQNKELFVKSSQNHQVTYFSLRIRK